MKLEKHSTMDRPDDTSPAMTSGENDPRSGLLSSHFPGSRIELSDDDDSSSDRVTSTSRQHTRRKSFLIAILLLILLVLGVVGIVIGLDRESPAAPARDELSQGEQGGALNEDTGPTEFPAATGDLGPLGCQAGSKLLELELLSTTKTPYTARAQHGTNYTWKLVDCANRVVAQCERPCAVNANTKSLRSKDQHFDHWCVPDDHSLRLEVHVDTDQSCCGFEVGNFALEYNGGGQSNNLHLTQIARSSIKKDDFVDDEDLRVWSIEIGKQVSPCLSAVPPETSSPMASRDPTKSFAMTPVKGPSQKPSQPPPALTSAPSKVSSAPPSQIPTDIPNTAPIQGPLGRFHHHQNLHPRLTSNSIPSRT